MKRLVATAALVAALGLPSVALAGGSNLPTLPLGTYTATLKAPPQVKGTWTLTFLKTGKYRIAQNGKIVVRGTFTSTSMVYLAMETGPRACASFGVYSWKRSGRTLRLTKVSDPCAGRAAVLSHPLTAAKA